MTDDATRQIPQNLYMDDRCKRYWHNGLSLAKQPLSNIMIENVPKMNSLHALTVERADIWYIRSWFILLFKEGKNNILKATSFSCIVYLYPTLSHMSWTFEITFTFTQQGKFNLNVWSNNCNWASCLPYQNLIVFVSQLGPGLIHTIRLWSDRWCNKTKYATDIWYWIDIIVQTHAHVLHCSDVSR